VLKDEGIHIPLGHLNHRPYGPIDLGGTDLTLPVQGHIPHPFTGFRVNPDQLVYRVLDGYGAVKITQYQYALL
jgi:hypothetical protein